MFSNIIVENHLLYDANFTFANEETEIPLHEIVQYIPEINRSILKYFNFDFHTGLIGDDLADKVKWAFPRIDIFEGKTYLVIEIATANSCKFTKEDIALLTESFSGYDNWRMEVEYRGKHVFIDVEWENLCLKLSEKYTWSAHYRFNDFFNFPVNPMTVESNTLIRDYFHRLKIKYPEIDITKSTIIYGAAKQAVRAKVNPMLITVLSGSDNITDDLKDILCYIAYIHEIYKSLEQWTSLSKFESIEYRLKEISKFANLGDMAELLRKFEETQKSVSAFKEQVQQLFNMVGDSEKLPDELKDCFKEFII